MLATIKAILTFILHFLLFAVTILVLIVPFVALTIYKSVIIFIANKILRQGLIPFDDGVKGIDSIFLKVDATELLLRRKKDQCKNRNKSNRPNCPIICANAAVVMKYEGNAFSLVKVRKIFYEKFLQESRSKFLNLQIKLVKFCGYFFKQKVETIDLETIIYSVELSETKSSSLEEYVADWFLNPFVSKKGLLWEVVLINSNNNEQNCLAIKIHHSLADGFTSTHLLDKLCGKKTKYLVENFKDTFLDKVLMSVKAPGNILNFLSKIYTIGNQKYLSWNYKNLETRVSFGTLEISKLKQVRRKLNIKLQCIFYGLMSEALRELCKANKVEIPESGKIVMTGSLPLPRHPFKERMANWFSTIFLEVPIGEDCSTKRLLAIDKDFNSYHSNGLNKTLVQNVGYLFSLLPYCISKRINDTSISASCSSLLLGDDYELFGQKINHIYVVGPQLEGTALATFSASHSDKFDYTIIANRQLISQEGLDILTRDFIPRELNKLYNDGNAFPSDVSF